MISDVLRVIKRHSSKNIFIFVHSFPNHIKMVLLVLKWFCKSFILTLKCQIIFLVFKIFCFENDFQEKNSRECLNLNSIHQRNMNKIWCKVLNYVFCNSLQILAVLLDFSSRFTWQTNHEPSWVTFALSLDISTSLHIFFKNTKNIIWCCSNAFEQWLEEGKRYNHLRSPVQNIARNL